MVASPTDKPKRSVELTEKQVNYLKKEIENHESKTAASIALGVSKDVLDRTIAFGSCSEKTYHILFPEVS